VKIHYKNKFSLQFNNKSEVMERPYVLLNIIYSIKGPLVDKNCVIYYAIGPAEYILYNIENIWYTIFSLITCNRKTKIVCCKE